MKKIVLAVLTVLITSSTAMSQDFRKATWGMSPSEVKSSESDELIQESDEILVYETTLAGFEAYAGYIFADGKLVRAKYILTEEHTNENDYIDDYNRLNGLLKKKYGEAIADENIWVNDDSVFKDDLTYWGSCIRRGELMLYSTYRNATTEIELSLFGEDYTIINGIQYTSLSPELNNLEEEKYLEDL